jgi:hypothetical protein
MKIVTAIAAVTLLAATPVFAQSIADEQAKADYHQAKADAARADDAKVDAQVQANVSASDAANAQAQANVANSNAANLQARADMAKSQANAAQSQANASQEQANASHAQGPAVCRGSGRCHKSRARCACSVGSPVTQKPRYGGAFLFPASGGLNPVTSPDTQTRAGSFCRRQ